MTEDATEDATHGVPSGREYLRIILIAASIGVPAALVAAVFLAAVNRTQRLLWTDLPRHLGGGTPQWYLVVGLPIIGAIAVALVRRFLPGDGGESPLRGFAMAPSPLSHGPGIALAAFATLAFGAALGPEAPLVALGSVTGAVALRFVRLPPREGAVVQSAGSFSAISALFDGPLVAGILLVEAGAPLGAALIPALLPGLVAAAIGYVLFVGLGDWGGISSTPLEVPGLPAYHGTRVIDLVLAIVVGAVVAVVIGTVRRLARAVASPDLARFTRIRLTTTGLLLAGALALGVVTLVAEALGATSSEVLFSGQSSLPALVGESSAGVLLVLVVAKGIAYAVCMGCGFRGGPIFPAIFLGIAVATLPVVWFDVSPTWAVAIGTAAGMAATSRLLFAPLLLGALLVGADSVDVIPAAVLASATAWITITALARYEREPAPAPS